MKELVRAAVVNINEPQQLLNRKKAGDDSRQTWDHYSHSHWEQNIGELNQYNSYQFNRMQVHRFLDKYKLSFPRFGASFHEVDDLEKSSSMWNKNQACSGHKLRQQYLLCKL